MTIRTRVLAPLGTFVAVAAVAVTATLVSHGGGASKAPAVLHLAGPQAKQAAAGSSGGGYRLRGTLPAGRPTDAPVWTLSTPRDTARLAEALGGKGLTVSHGAWSWSVGCRPDTPVASDGTTATSGCAVANSSGSGGGSATGSAPTVVAPTPAPTPAPALTPAQARALTPAQARAAAEPVFAAVGLRADEARVDTGGYGASLTLDPIVGGLPTSGFTTRVELDSTRHVTSASGLLGLAVKGSRYPLLTAQEAFERIPFAPAVEMLCRVAPDGSGCVQPPAPEITGAQLGLQLQQLRDGDQLLVPAWLFTLKGSDYPVAQVAVTPEFLGRADPEPSDNPEPGSPPAQREPAPPARQPLSFDSAFRGKDPDTLIVQYGDSSSCPHAHVTHSVKEDARSVTVVLESDGRDPNLVCTDNYRGRLLTLPLQAPLGDRTVVDGAKGTPVPLKLS